MSIDNLVSHRVHDYFWRKDLNCATASLKILAETFQVQLDDQILDAAVGMNGAGEYGAQCGLVEGALMFLGILGRARDLPKQQIVALCRNYTKRFEDHFESLECRVLRPEGFTPENPPHLCERFSCEAIEMAIAFMQKAMQKQF